MKTPPHRIPDWRISISMLFAFGGLLVPANAQRQMEKLGHGVVAVRTGSNQVYVGWRLLGNDPEEVAFNVYRSPTSGGAAVLLAGSPFTIQRNAPPHSEPQSAKSQAASPCHGRPLLGYRFKSSVHLRLSDHGCYSVPSSAPEPMRISRRLRSVHSTASYFFRSTTPE